MINNVAKQIISKFQVNKFIETGAFMGDTLMIVQDWFCELYGKDFNTGPWQQGQRGRHRIYEVEINRDYLDQYIVPRHQKQINVEVVHSDSVKWLSDKIAQGEFDRDNCFFYLDAHSHGSHNPEPLKAEIQQIGKLQSPIISCDDWHVPHGNPDVYNTSQIKDLIQNRTDVVYYSSFHNFHGKWSVFIFLDRYQKELDEILDDVPLIAEPL